MKSSWDWPDYQMDFKPIITSDDYTIKAFGRDDEIDSFIKDAAAHARQSTRMLYKLRDYWGAGKSTFLYNICYNVNERLFFDDGIEDPTLGQYTHVLAFFQETQRKRSDLLERVYQIGLPVTWTPERPKAEAEELGKDYWRKCLRKLAFVYLRRAVSTISKRKLEEAATGGAVGRKAVFDKILELSNMSTQKFITKLDEEQLRSDQFFEESGEIMRFYAKMILPSIEVRRGNRKIVEQELFEQQFPKFLYSENSNEFLVAYNSLFSTQERNLRYFQAFEKLLRATSTYLIIVFDEVEDWSQVVRDKIDRDIHDLVVDAESQISLILVFRTEVLQNVSSNAALGTFMTIYDRLHNLAMKPLSVENVKKLTAGVLSSSRSGRLSTFPCTDDFVKTLIERTQRAKTFNPRSYLAALDTILDNSLNWPRESADLTPDLLDRDDAKEAISQTLKNEDTRARLTQLPERLE